MSITAENNSGKPVISIRNVWKFFGQLAALKDICLDIMPGEKVVIIGPSGSGKSTCLRTINRLENVDKGTIYVEGQDITSSEHDINAMRQNLGMVFQSFNLFPHMTVLRNLTVAPMKLRGLSRADAEERALLLLKKVGLADKVNVYPNTLSGGQQQRVAIARAVVTNPKLILADEPTGNLDSKNGAEVMALLTELNKEGTTIVMVTHSRHDASFAHRTVHLFDGSIVASAAYVYPQRDDSRNESKEV